MCISIDVLGATIVRERSQQIRRAKQNRRNEREGRRPNAVAEIPEERHREVHGELRSDDHGVDLELGVAQAFLEEVAIEGEGGDRAGTEAGEDSGREGDIASYVALLPPSIVSCVSVVGRESEELDDGGTRYAAEERSLCGGHYRGPRDGTGSSRTAWQHVDIE